MAGHNLLRGSDFPVHKIASSTAFLLCVVCTPAVRADTLTVAGLITQSTQDGTGPAVNNPSFNNIADGASYLAGLSFRGSIHSTGTFDLTGSAFSFSVGAASALESSFESISLTVAPFGGLDQVSILACLTTGSACNQGNELELDFTIASVDFNNQNVVAQGVLNLLPLDLLEDDGVTDIHGSVANYSYISDSRVPEPSAPALAALGLVAIVVGRLKLLKRY